MTEPRREKTYWLDKKENVTKLYYALIGVCLALFLSDAIYHKHVEFPLEGWFGFYALFGFVGIVVLVLVAREMRKVLMRPEDYYDE